MSVVEWTFLFVTVVAVPWSLVLSLVLTERQTPCFAPSDFSYSRDERT